MTRNIAILMIFSITFIQSPAVADGVIDPLLNKKEGRMTLSIDSKSFIYNEDRNEEVTLIGGRSRKYFQDSDWYWGEAGYAAIKGKRHGYIEGAVFLGYRPELTEKITLDLCLSLGAAGGGGEKSEGGGLNAQTYLGLGYRIVPDYNLYYFYGYTTFLNGALESPIWGFGVAHDFTVFKGVL